MDLNSKSRRVAIAGRIVCCLLLFIWSPLKAETIKLVAMEYPPYYGPSLPQYGPLTSIIKQAFQHRGYEVDVQFSPWARALKQVYSGDAHGIIGIWKSPEREKRFIYSQSLLDNQMGFFTQQHKQINIQQLTTAHSKKYKLASVHGYILPANLSSSNFENFFVANDRQSLRMLDANRVDVILIDYFYARYMFQQNGFEHMADKLKWLGVIDTPAQYLAMTKKHQRATQLIEQFNLGLKQLKDSGRYCQILKQFQMGVHCSVNDIKKPSLAQ